MDEKEDQILAKPQWANLYGPSLSHSVGGLDRLKSIDAIAQNQKKYGQQLGTFYRGRVLYTKVRKKLALDGAKTKLKEQVYTFPTNPLPVAPSRNYIVTIDIFEGFELPEPSPGRQYI